MPNASIDLACRPTLTAIPAGQERTLHVLIRSRVGVPEGKVDRSRLSAVLALDVSGSMQGQPIEHVIRSSECIVDPLAESNSVGFVAFSSTARVVAPLHREALAEVGVAQADEQRTRARRFAARRDFTEVVAVLRRALRVIEATPGLQRGKGDPLDDAYDVLLDDCTIYEQKPSEERSAHSFKAQQDFLSLSSFGTRKRLVIEAGAGAGNTYELVDGRTVIGRGSSCDVSIPIPNLSRQHALIERIEDEFWLVDMGSTNGVQVRGRNVQRHELKPGDVFELGDVRIRFERN